MTPTPTLPDSTAVVGEPGRTEVTYEMVRAASESQARDHEGEFLPLHDLLGFSGENKTHTVIRAALEAALASRSTQPEGAPRDIGYPSYHCARCGLDDQGIRAALALIDATPKPLPQPEAAASGEVGEIERRVDAIWELTPQDEPAREAHVALAQAIRSLAAQARAQAMEEAAKVAEAQVERDRGMLKDDRANAVMAMLTGREIAKEIRALIPQPSAPAGEVQALRAMLEETSAYIDTMPAGTYGATRQMMRIRDVLAGTAHRQPEPGSTQGGSLGEAP